MKKINNFLSDPYNQGAIFGFALGTGICCLLFQIKLIFF